MYASANYRMETVRGNNLQFYVGLKTALLTRNEIAEIQSIIEHRTRQTIEIAWR